VSIRVNSWIIPLALCALAFALRLGPAFQNRFHADEALYSSWAMQIASGRDPLLAAVPVDKPPLALYAMAASLWAFGRSEIAARLPSLIASVVSVALAWRWARTLAPSPSPVDRRGELFAAFVMAFSPFNIAFGGTAFLDPLMVMWGLAACVAAARGRYGWAGSLLGLAFATKAQGLLFAPLVILTAKYAESAKKGSAFSARSAVKFFMGLSLILTLLAAWSLARSGTPFWVQQAINYGGIRPAFASEVVPRLTRWLELLPYFFGPILSALVLGGMLMLLGNTFARAKRTRAAALDLLLIAYTLGFFALHWLLAFPVWDRYLLVLVPVVAVLSGRLVGWVVGWLDDSRRQFAIKRVVFSMATLLILPYTIQAARSELSIGGDRGSHDGIDRVVVYLRDLPPGSVVYDHWLGWEFDFYLWDAPLYRAYFDTPSDLARDLHAFGRTSPRYLVAPGGASLAKIERAIAAEGFYPAPVLATPNRHGQTSFTVYRLLSNNFQ